MPEESTADDPTPPDENRIREALRLVIDPEVGINIVDLGLVYGVVVRDGAVRVTMTMTTPACPLGEHLTREVEARVRAEYPGFDQVEVEIVWDPPWNPHCMSLEARQQLGWPA
jgi:metal-sulfur cluster biosynthetic enzyme